jgi:hypothetical protein
VGKDASSSEVPAAEFHEPLVGAPIREEDDRAWPNPVGDLSNAHGTSRGSDRGHARNIGHGRGRGHFPGHHHRRGRACRGRAVSLPLGHHAIVVDSANDRTAVAPARRQVLKDIALLSIDSQRSSVEEHAPHRQIRVGHRRRYPPSFVYLSVLSCSGGSNSSCKSGSSNSADGRTSKAAKPCAPAAGACGSGLGAGALATEMFLGNPNRFAHGNQAARLHRGRPLAHHPQDTRTTSFRALAYFGDLSMRKKIF